MCDTCGEDLTTPIERQTTECRLCARARWLALVYRYGRKPHGVPSGGPLVAAQAQLGLPPRPGRLPSSAERAAALAREAHRLTPLAARIELAQLSCRVPPFAGYRRLLRDLALGRRVKPQRYLQLLDAAGGPPDWAAPAADRLLGYGRRPPSHVEDRLLRHICSGRRATDVVHVDRQLE